jgi:ubiquinone/menaquinone biosynthesis C-methylase UbiE
MNNIPIIFNRDKVKNYRNRAADNINNHDFLLREVGERMLESLDCIKGDFENILHIGCGSDYLLNILRDRTETKLLVSQDISFKMAKKINGLSVVADEEQMPYADESFDLVVANLVLHCVNDLPGTLIQIRKMLKKNGVFLATFYGVGTLTELYQVLLELETEISGGATPRIFPFSEVKTMGSLMQRVGFSEVVTDCDSMEVEYDDVFALIADLRGMGESNALTKGGKTLNRKVITRLGSFYTSKFSDGKEGFISTFNIINITGLASFGV